MKIHLILLCFFSSIFVNRYSQTIYKNTSSGYSFEIPVGWKQIPKTEVDDLAKSISDKTKYDAGFYPDKKRDSDGWGYPYILAHFKAGKLQESKFEEISKTIIKNYNCVKKDVLKNISSKFIDVMSNLNAGEAFYDKVNHCVIFSIDGNISGFGAIKMVTVIFLSNRGALFLNYYDTTKGIKASLKIFIKIASTVKID